MPRCVGIPSVAVVPGGRGTVENAGAGHTFTLAHLLSNRVVTGL